jgi:hypothetical protein
MKCEIHAYIIYHVEPIPICEENLLLLLSEIGVQQQVEQSAPLAGELLTVIRGVGGVKAIPVVGEDTAAARVAQPCLQGRERQLTHCRLTRRKRDEGVSIKARKWLLTRSRGLL